MRTLSRLRPRHDVDLVTADGDRDLDAHHGADPGAPEPGRIDDARRLDWPAARVDPTNAAALGADGEHLRLFEDACPPRAGGVSEALGRLGGGAVTRGPLAA